MIDASDGNKEEKNRLKEYEEVYFDYMQEEDRGGIQGGKQAKGDDLPPGVIKLVKVLIAKKRKDIGRRQAFRTPREQRRNFQDAAGRGHAVPFRRHACGRDIKPARRPFAYERGTASGNTTWVGRRRKLGKNFETPVFNGMKEAEVKDYNEADRRNG